VVPDQHCHPCPRAPVLLAALRLRIGDRWKVRRERAMRLGRKVDEPPLYLWVFGDTGWGGREGHGP
jgi:hypothetical protein